MERTQERDPISFRVIERPDILNADQCIAMRNEWLSLCLKAFSGDQAFPPEYEQTWIEILGSELDRPTNCDRIVVARTELYGLVSFVSLRKYLINRRPVMYCSFAATLPQFRGAFVTKRVTDLLFADEYVQKFAGGYLAWKTANPAAYMLGKYSMKRIANIIGIRENMCPEINEYGTISKIPISLKNMARLILRTAGGLDRFNQDTFVVSGIGSGRYAPYHDYSFKCSNRGVAEFFKNQINAEVGDSLFVLGRL